MHDHDGHDQYHAHDLADKLRRYWWAFGITLCVVLLQFAVRFLLANSLTLLGDALHMLSDNLVYGGAVVVLTYEVRGKDVRGAKKYMLYLGICSLVLGALYVLYEGLGRIMHPISFEPLVVMLTAGISAAGNIWALTILKNVHKDHHDGLHKNFVVHLLSDSVASAFVLVSALFVYFFALPVVDGYLSVLLAGYMLYLARHLWQEGQEELPHDTHQE